MKPFYVVFSLAISIVYGRQIDGNGEFLKDSDSVFKFGKWMQKHGKSYSTMDEYAIRLSIFEDNIEKIDNLNVLYAKDGVTFAENRFADMTEREFSSKILMPKRQPAIFSRSNLHQKAGNSPALPKEFDWSDKGVVTVVRDQGDAGTCWAFSAVQNIEGQWAMKSKQLIELAVEQVVECDASQDNAQNKADCGVFGGWPYLAYGYVQRVGGIQTENDYPYCSGLGGDKGTCYICQADDYNKTLCGPPVEYCKKEDSCDAKIKPSLFVPGLKIVGWTWFQKNESEIAQALVETGPLSVAINAETLQFYRSGVWDPLFCDPKSLDHAVLITGYGTSKGLFGAKDYWKVKNSWGRKWGENGYFRIARGKGKCGINTQVTTAHLK